MSSLTRERLLHIEHLGWNALCTSRGGTFYGELMTPDALMVLINGMVLDRGTVATTLNDSPPWKSYVITAPRLVHSGEESAALVYHASARRDNGKEPFVALMSSVYRIIDGNPRLALYQQTATTH